MITCAPAVSVAVAPMQRRSEAGWLKGSRFSPVARLHVGRECSDVRSVCVYCSLFYTASLAALPHSASTYSMKPQRGAPSRHCAVLLHSSRSPLRFWGASNPCSRPSGFCTVGCTSRHLGPPTAPTTQVVRHHREALRLDPTLLPVDAATDRWAASTSSPGQPLTQ